MRLTRHSQRIVRQIWSEGLPNYPRRFRVYHARFGAQVDGFRFDIMGHMMVSSMKAAQAALAALTPARDGVDGAALYLYGEAWDFGEARAPFQTLARP